MTLRYIDILTGKVKKVFMQLKVKDEQERRRSNKERDIVKKRDPND